MLFGLGRRSGVLGIWSSDLTWVTFSERAEEHLTKVKDPAVSEQVCMCVQWGQTLQSEEHSSMSASFPHSRLAAASPFWLLDYHTLFCFILYCIGSLLCKLWATLHIQQPFSPFPFLAHIPSVFLTVSHDPCMHKSYNIPHSIFVKGYFTQNGLLIKPGWKKIESVQPD